MTEAMIAVSLPDGRMTPAVPLSVAKKALEQVTGKKIDDASSDQIEAFSKDETGEIHVENVAAAELRQFIERVERLEEEKASVVDDIKDVLGKAKGRGYDAKAKPGDTILFRWVERRGGADVVANPDGTPGTWLRCPDTPDMFTGETMSPPEMPTADINHFWDVGLGLIADTLAGFAEEYAEMVGPLREPTTVFVLMRRISDPLTFRISDDGKSLTPIGLPIGSLTSQIFASVYAGVVDRHLQQTLGERYWYRYMDDIVVLGRSMEHLCKVGASIEELSREQLGLRFSKWSIQPVNRGVNFVGYRIWPTHKLLLRDSVVRARRKIKAYRAAGDHERLKKFLAAWTGHAKWADSRNLLRSLGLPITAFGDRHHVGGAPCA